MVFKTCRTIYNIKLQTAKLLELPYTTLPNTTLNEKFGIQPNYPTTGYPKLNLLTIGIGGVSTIDSTPSSLKTSLHSPVHACLFEHIPFVLRTADNPLPDSDASKYRLKKIFNINNIDYVGYYARLIDDIIYQNEIYYANTTNDLSILAPYDTLYNPELLNPTPIVNNDLTTMSSSFIFNMCKIPITFTEDDVTELKNVISILYPDKDISIISEIGLCSSIDAVLNDNTTEAVSVQINYFVDVDIDLQMLDNLNSDEIEFYLEIGGAEPLYI